MFRPSAGGQHRLHRHQPDSREDPVREPHGRHSDGRVSDEEEEEETVEDLLCLCFNNLCFCVRSVCLLLQVALPCALYADGVSKFCLKGGTNAEMAPQIDYTLKVLRPEPGLLVRTQDSGPLFGSVDEF